MLQARSLRTSQCLRNQRCRPAGARGPRRDLADCPRGRLGTRLLVSVGTLRGQRPGPRGPGSGRYQILSWVTKFMRSAAAVLMGFWAMWPRISAR